MKKLNVGIIGFGIGQQHAETYARHKECSVAAICDLSPEKVSKFNKEFPDAKTYSNARELIQDPNLQIVSIASFDADHAEQVLTALRAGKHVFVEKPLCLKVSELNEIRKELERNPNLKMGTNLLLRHSPRFMRLKEELDKGTLGEIYNAEIGYHYGRIEKLTSGWRGDDPNYSVVLGGGIHVIDLLLWILKGQVEQVSAFGNQIVTRSTKVKSDDFVGALLHLKNGVVATLTVNFGCIYPHFHPFKVYGTTATFVNGFNEGELWTAKDKNAVPVKITEEYPGVEKGALIPNFVDSVLGRRQLEISYDEIFHVLKVCFAIDLSKAERRVVELSEFV